MAEDYKPSKKEVIGVIIDGVKNKIPSYDISKIGDSIKEFSLATSAGIAILLTAPYIIPHFIRNTKNVKINIPGGVDTGGYFGTTLGVASLIGQAAGYHHLSTVYDRPEWLLVPVATNVISGVYEIGRFIYNKAEQEFLKNHKPNSLESKVESLKPLNTKKS